MRTLISLTICMCCASTEAGVIRATPTVSGDATGYFAVVYDDSFNTANAVYFEIGGENNFGVFARDFTPTGWVDPMLGQWDLTVDGMGYQGLSVGVPTPGIDWSLMVTDGVRLVNDGVDSYVSYTHPTQGWVSSNSPTDWQGTALSVPEASALVLLLCGLFAIRVLR